MDSWIIVILSWSIGASMQKTLQSEFKELPKYFLPAKRPTTHLNLFVYHNTPW